MTINANDILITIHQSINSESNGFKTILDECQTEKEKVCFIEKTMELVMNGWSSEFEQSLDSSEIGDAKYFLIDTAKNFFVNSRTTVFSQRQNISAHDQPIISLFAQLALLKAIYTCCIKDESLYSRDLYTSIQTANSELSKKYLNLATAQNRQVMLNGRPITSLEQLDSVMEGEHRRVDNTLRNATISLAIPALAVLFLFQYGDKLPSEARIALCIAALTPLLYVFYASRQAQSHFFLPYTDLREQITDGQSLILNNNDIKKFFLLSQEEKSKLDVIVASHSIKCE